MALNFQSAYTRTSGNITDIFIPIDRDHEQWIAQVVFEDGFYELSSQNPNRELGDPANDYMVLYIYGTFKTLNQAIANCKRYGTFETTGRKYKTLLR